MLQLEQTVKEQKASQRVTDEYKALVAGTTATGVCIENEIDQQPLFAEDELREKMPGNLRKPEHLVSVLRKLVVYFKSLLASKEL